MLLDKHEPKKLEEFLGNKKNAETINDWIKNWKKGSIIITGPTGTGKTLLIKLLCKLNNYSLIDIESSEIEPKDLLESSKQNNIFGKKNVIVIDNADSLRYSKNVIDLIENVKCPLIFILDDAYSSFLRKYCTIIKFDRVRYDSICKLLENVGKKDMLNIEKAGQISKSANGDVRASLIDMEYSAENSYRDSEEMIFNTIKIIFKTNSLDNVLIAMSNYSGDDLFSWLSENISKEYDGEDLAKAYDFLSKADVFKSRILKRQSWSLQKYFTCLSAVGVALSKTKDNKRFVSYTPPRFFRKSDTEINKDLHISKKKLYLYNNLI